MTVVPLPDVPCVRVRLGFTDNGGTEAGNRFYLSYTGSAPTGANCITLATDIATAYQAHIAPMVYAGTALTEVDVLDIATETGSSGTVSVDYAGGDSGSILPNNVAINVEFDIARRYRGGKPRIFWPTASAAQLASGDKWTSGFIAACNTNTAAFFSAIEALTVGSMGTLQHVNLSYYKGFTNITNSSGRERAAPKYRDTALHDPVLGYATKAVVGSQRRRRTATTI